jgi:hypothetical protein
MGDALLNSKKGVQRRRSIPTDFALRVHMTSSACSEFILKGSFRPQVSPSRRTTEHPKTAVHSALDFRLEREPVADWPVLSRGCG